MQACKLRLFIGVYFVLLAAIVSASALTLPVVSYDPFFESPMLSLEIFALLAGLIIFGLGRIETVGIWQVLSIFGIIAALFSISFKVVAAPGLDVCAPLPVRQGFPLSFYLSGAYLNVKGCFMRPPINGPRLVGVFFLLDVLFYVAVGLGVVEIGRGTRILIQRRNSITQAGSSSGPILSSLEERQ